MEGVLRSWVTSLKEDTGSPIKKIQPLIAAAARANSAAFVGLQILRYTHGGIVWTHALRPLASACIGCSVSGNRNWSGG